MTRRRRVGIVLAAVLAAFAAYEVAASYIAYTADAYVTSDLVAVAPEVTGRLIAVAVHDNQNVARGDLLATIDPVPFQLLVDQRQAELAEARAQATVDQAEVAAAEADLQAASSAASLAGETRRRQAALAADLYVSREQLDRAESALRQAEAALQGKRDAIARARAIGAMHATAEARAAAALASAQWQLARTRIVAPVDGTVTHMTLRVGDTARAEEPLIGIVDAHAWRIVANYTQSFVRGFSPGDAAWVWLDSEPWHLHRATVAGVARAISRQPEPVKLLPYVAPTTDWIRLQRRFPVTLTLVDRPADGLLFMGADARVLVLP